MAFTVSRSRVLAGAMMAQSVFAVLRPNVLSVIATPVNAPRSFSEKLMLQPPPSIRLKR